MAKLNGRIIVPTLVLLMAEFGFAGKIGRFVGENLNLSGSDVDTYTWSIRVLSVVMMVVVSVLWLLPYWGKTQQVQQSSATQTPPVQPAPFVRQPDPVAPQQQPVTGRPAVTVVVSPSTEGPVDAPIKRKTARKGLFYKAIEAFIHALQIQPGYTFATWQQLVEEKPELEAAMEIRSGVALVCEPERIEMYIVVAYYHLGSEQVVFESYDLDTVMGMVDAPFRLEENDWWPLPNNAWATKYDQVGGLRYVTYQLEGGTELLAVHRISGHIMTPAEHRELVRLEEEMLQGSNPAVLDSVAHLEGVLKPAPLQEEEETVVSAPLSQERSVEKEEEEEPTPALTLKQLKEQCSPPEPKTAAFTLMDPDNMVDETKAIRARIGPDAATAWDKAFEKVVGS